MQSALSYSEFYPPLGDQSFSQAYPSFEPFYEIPAFSSPLPIPEPCSSNVSPYGYSISPPASVDGHSFSYDSQMQWNPLMEGNVTSPYPMGDGDPSPTAPESVK